MLVVKQSQTFQLLMQCQVHKKLGEDTVRTADLNWLKEYSIPHDITVRIYSGGNWSGVLLLANWLGIV